MVGRSFAFFHCLLAFLPLRHAQQDHMMPMKEFHARLAELEAMPSGPCTMHTFFDPTALEGDGDVSKLGQLATLEAWKGAWEAAGWKTRVLNEATAKSHPEYEDLKAQYLALPTTNPKKYEVACFLRHIAQASVGGGWHSDYDAIPVRYSGEGSGCVEELPNKGGYTSFQNHVPSVLSGNQSEYERVARRMGRTLWTEDKQLFSVNGKPHMSDMQVLALLVRTGEVQVFDPLCGSVNADEVFGPHEGRTCEGCRGKPPFALHFSHASLDSMKHSGLACLEEGVSSTYAHWNFKRAACLREASSALKTGEVCKPDAVADRLRELENPSQHPSGDCTMHTYFDPWQVDEAEGGHYAKVGLLDTIEAWREGWEGAGWGVRVLNSNSAAKHPQFGYLMENFEKRPIKPTKYETLVFMRHVAMAGAGIGGWVSDFDVLPLRHGCLALPNNGQYTAHQIPMPWSLTSGTRYEINQIAFRMATYQTTLTLPPAVASTDGNDPEIDERRRRHSSHLSEAFAFLHFFNKTEKNQPKVAFIPKGCGVVSAKGFFSGLGGVVTGFGEGESEGKKSSSSSSGATAVCKACDDLGPFALHFSESAMRELGTTLGCLKESDVFAATAGYYGRSKSHMAACLREAIVTIKAHSCHRRLS